MTKIFNRKVELLEETSVSFSKRGGVVILENGDKTHSFTESDFYKFLSERYNGDGAPDNYFKSW